MGEGQKRIPTRTSAPTICSFNSLGYCEGCGLRPLWLKMWRGFGYRSRQGRILSKCWRSLKALAVIGVRAKLLSAEWLGVSAECASVLIFVGVREDLGLEPVHPRAAGHTTTLFAMRCRGFRGNWYKQRHLRRRSSSADDHDSQ